MWKLWCLALGRKEGKNNKEADKVAIIRTIIFLTYFITNVMICSGVIQHWNDNQQINKSNLERTK